MVRCIVCKKTSDEVELFKGIQVDGMVMVCSACAEKEGIPVIKKPSESQLNKADKRYSVRERMERMSGIRDTTEVSEDQMITQGNLAKLRVPPKKEHHNDILDNYYWTLNIARRRAKFSIGQLAEKMQIDSKIIQGIERGKIPENFEEIFIKLEAFLGIKLLKNHKTKINFIRTKDEELDILKNVRRKMGETVIDYEDEILTEIENKKEQLDKLSKGELDFSKRETLSDITLDDLVDRKKKKQTKKDKAKEDAMLGDDLDLNMETL